MTIGGVACTSVHGIRGWHNVLTRIMANSADGNGDCKKCQ